MVVVTHIVLCVNNIEHSDDKVPLVAHFVRLVTEL